MIPPQQAGTMFLRRQRDRPAAVGGLHRQPKRRKFQFHFAAPFRSKEKMR